MSLNNGLNDDPLPWLLEPDNENPGVRFFALTELVGKPAEDPEVVAARKQVMESGPVPAILDAQDPEGWWVKSGAGYGPKYRGSVWQVSFLAQFGADGTDPRVHAGCDYLLTHNPAKNGGFSYQGLNSGLLHCLQGNVGAALIDLGWLGDERLDKALDWMARSVTGQDISPSSEKKAPVRYLRSGNSGPGFPCSANDHLPCAWGAVKVMLALSKVPDSARTEVMDEAIEVGLEFLLSRDPAVADYPMGYSEKPNLSWFRFGYPIGYVTDVLQNLEVLSAFGFGNDPRLRAAIDLVLDRQDENGRWAMKYTYNGKTWVDVEEKHKPSKWVTLRVMRVLSRVTSDE